LSWTHLDAKITFMAKEKICSEYLTISEAGRELGVCRQTVYSMIKEGLPVTKIHKTKRIKRQDLIDYLETQNRSK